MTYLYTCTHCKHSWQLEQRITELPATLCPQCGNETAKRLISGAPSFKLKGSGWASDGYATAGKGSK